MAHTGLNEAERLSFYIVYGWSEGPWQGKKMQQIMLANGFTAAKQASEADIIIAHSLGCYLVPKENRAKIILLIGLSYWPDKLIFASLLQHITQNFKNSLGSNSSWWLSKLSHNCRYIITRPKSSYNAIFCRKISNLPNASATRQVFLVRNASDPFCPPHIQSLIPKDMGYEFLFNIGNGQHEDCWLNPDPYVNLICRSI